MATLLGDSNSDDSSSSDESSLDMSLISSSRTSFMSTNNNSPTPLKHKMSRWLGKLNLPGGKHNGDGNTTTNLDFNDISFSSSGSDTDSSDSDYDTTKPRRRKKRSVLRFDLGEDLSVSGIGSFLGATNNFSDDEDLKMMKHGKTSNITIDENEDDGNISPELVNITTDANMKRQLEKIRRKQLKQENKSIAHQVHHVANPEEAHKMLIKKLEQAKLEHEQTLINNDGEHHSSNSTIESEILASSNNNNNNKNILDSDRTSPVILSSHGSRSSAFSPINNPVEKKAPLDVNDLNTMIGGINMNDESDDEDDFFSSRLLALDAKKKARKERQRLDPDYDDDEDEEIMRDSIQEMDQKQKKIKEKDRKHHHHHHHDNTNKKHHKHHDKHHKHHHQHHDKNNKKQDRNENILANIDHINEEDNAITNTNINDDDMDYDDVNPRSRSHSSIHEAYPEHDLKHPMPKEDSDKLKESKSMLQKEKEATIAAMGLLKRQIKKMKGDFPDKRQRPQSIKITIKGMKANLKEYKKNLMALIELEKEQLDNGSSDDSGDSVYSTNHNTPTKKGKKKDNVKFRHLRKSELEKIKSNSDEKKKRKQKDGGWLFGMCCGNNRLDDIDEVDED